MPNIGVDKKNYSKYFYQININLVDKTTNRQYQMDSNLLACKILFDYRNYVFPIFIIKVSLSKEEYTIIRDNSIEMKISIIKKIVANESNEKINTSIGDEYYIYNELFTIIDKNKITYNDSDLNDEVPSLDMTFTLFANKHLAVNKLKFNGNYLNCRPMEILSFLNGMNQDPLLIEQPHNSERYKQILIPPLNAPNLVKYLQEKYIIYRNGVNIFFDYDETIICNSTLSGNTPQGEGDYSNVIFDILDTSKNLEGSMPNDCGYKSPNGKYYYIKTTDTKIKISDKTRIKQEILGSNNIIFSKDESLDTERSSWEDEPEDKIIDKTQLYYDNFNNPYPMSNQSFESFTKAVYLFSNLDISTFKLNKIFYTKLNNIEYFLRVCKVGYVFTKDKETNLFLCNGSCIFESNS